LKFRASFFGIVSTRLFPRLHWTLTLNYTYRGLWGTMVTIAPAISPAVRDGRAAFSFSFPYLRRRWLMSYII
jgi:hypothetical protein